MNDDVAIQVDHVTKTFKLPHEKSSSLKSVLVGLGKGKRGYEQQTVLQDVSFEIKKGEFFGIVGRNGSGKSTMLKMLAGIYAPSKGEVHIQGKLTPFIELGVGFNPELTGRENVFLNGALLGFNRTEMNAMYRDIVAFAELEKFMDQKLKNYSSGMQVRLAFSIAIRAETDILVLDEVLAVGDAIFQKKCFEYFKQLKRDKRTVVFVSHDTNALQEYCDRGILIESGRLIESGDMHNIVNSYLEILNSRERSKIEDMSAKQETARHIGSGEMMVQAAKTGHTGSPKRQALFTEVDDAIGVSVTYEVHEDVSEPIYGISIYDASGACVFAANTMWSRTKVDDVQKGQTITAEWAVPNVFTTGDFSITPAVAAAGGTAMLDQVDAMTFFKVRKKQYSSAFINVPYDLKVTVG